MTTQKNFLLTALFLAVFWVASARAQSNRVQLSTPPVTLDEKEAMYNANIEDRAQTILKTLDLNDAAKSNRVHQAILAYYRALRHRDEAIDAELWSMNEGSREWENERMKMFPEMTKPLHEKFISELSADLTPEQLDKIKDKMTYSKVDFTYNAYCLILPDLTDAQKNKIMEMLKQARDEAIDGGSSGEKSAIFQKYKNQINEYLAAQGYDVAKATKDYTAKQETAKKQNGELK